MGLESNIARTSDSQTGTQQYTRPLVDMSDPTNFNKKLDTRNTPILVAHGGEDHGAGSEVKPEASHKKPADSSKPNSGTTDQGDKKPDATTTATDKPSQPTVGDNTSGKVDIHRLPNGDGHVVTKAEDLKPGAVLVSPKAYEQMKNGQTGAVEEGAWINPDGTYDLTRK